MTEGPGEQGGLPAFVGRAFRGAFVLGLALMLPLLILLGWLRHVHDLTNLEAAGIIFGATAILFGLVLAYSLRDLDAQREALRLPQKRH